MAPFGPIGSEQIPFTLSNIEVPHRVAMPRHRNLAWVFQKLCPGESGVFAEQIAQSLGHFLRSFGFRLGTRWIAASLTTIGQRCPGVRLLSDQSLRGVTSPDSATAETKRRTSAGSRVFLLTNSGEIIGQIAERRFELPLKSDDGVIHGHWLEYFTRKLAMLLRDEFLTPLRYYK